MNNSQKLSHEQYTELERQLKITPSVYDTFSPSGEHYMLRALLQGWGFRVGGGRGDEIELSERLLARGYAR